MNFGPWLCRSQSFHGAFALNCHVTLHAIDATPARWRGCAALSPLDAPDALVDFHTVGDRVPAKARDRDRTLGIRNF